MISIYNFSSLRSYIQAYFGQMPKGGHGQSLRLANHLKVHTTLVSQVLSGSKNFSLEQAARAVSFFGLLEEEAEYFVLLAQRERAGSKELLEILDRRLEEIKTNARNLSTRLEAKKNLSEAEKSVFYSDWIYSACRQMVAIPGYQSEEQIATRFGVAHKKVREVMRFLLDAGLCLKDEKGKLKVGPQSTHLESSSPWVRVHHLNWRQRAQENYLREDEVKLHYSCPMTISKKDAQALREKIIKFLESLDPLIEKSPSEELYCLNIDWFTG